MLAVSVRRGTRALAFGWDFYREMLFRSSSSLGVASIPFFTITDEQDRTLTLIGSDLGLRYDIAANSVTVMSQVKSDMFPAPSLAPRYVSYPRFTYFEPGKPLRP
jgi:hypothetical protein